MSDFSWEDYFYLAEELSKVQKEEYIRSAISRYYYYFFGLAKEYLILKNSISPESKGSFIHTLVSDTLEESSDDTEAFVGETLSSLRVERNKADYDVGNINLEYFMNEFDKIREKASMVFESIKYLIDNPSFWKVIFFLFDFFFIIIYMFLATTN